MSCNLVYMKDGAKYCRPVLTKEDYLELRSASAHLANLRQVREGNNAVKRRLIEFNYSLTAPEDSEGVFQLKGADTLGNSVGMDIDHLDGESLQDTINKVLEMKDELNLLLMERSARGEGLHVVFKRHPELTNEENLRWASELLGVEFDKGAKDVTRVFFATSNEPEDLIYLDEELFSSQPIAESLKLKEEVSPQLSTDSKLSEGEPPSYLGISYSDIIKKWWEMYNDGKEPVKSNRDVLTFELAVNLRHICGFDRDLMDKVIPCYDGFPQNQKMKCIDSALAEKRTQMPKRLKDVLSALRMEVMHDDDSSDFITGLDNALSEDDLYYYKRLPMLPQGIRDSVNAVGPHLAMPVITAVCPIIGSLATGVVLDVHGIKKNLNLISYIAGDFASGKGSIDPVVDTWTAETRALDKMYLEQEAEWRERKRAAKNKKEQPEEPKLPVRCLTLNNTVANLAERLANTEGKHAFSFTPEADTVAQKWKSAMSDFSVMLRQSYDGTAYEREARSADAVNVHIDHLLWNVVMCGTPDALYRVVNNYTDGFQSRLAVARTPDNTFMPLEEKPHVLNDRQIERIHQVAHLLPLMSGEIVLPKLEEHGREWLESIRTETLKNNDTVKARQRFRVCVTAQRMTCCLMLCKVCETLIQKHGINGAETKLKQYPSLWKEMLLKTQTSTIMNAFDVLADSLLENALYYFRDRIEVAFSSRNYSGCLNNERTRRSKNDSIFERLDLKFTFAQALQHAVAVKGNGVTKNSVYQMLKNWRLQNLIIYDKNKNYCKIIE